LQPKILFLSPYIPYKKNSVKRDPLDIFYYRNTFDQGIFQLRQTHSWHPLHYLAQNLGVYSVVLENPLFKQFKNEVKKGGYDIIAFTFTAVLIKRLLKMVRWVKKMYPNITIIVGGHGTTIFDTNFKDAKALKNKVDLICNGEGLEFLKSYLKEHWNIHKHPEIRQDLIITKNSFFRSHISIFKQFSLVSSLGCKNGCSFCATSHFFNKKNIRLLSSQKLYATLKQLSTKYPDICSAIIYDENFLNDKNYILEFINYLDKDPELQNKIFLTIFSSVEAISQYSIEELIHCSIGTIFIGVESFDNQIQKTEFLHKRKGKNIFELFDSLHNAGINTLGSMIIGWDKHSKANIHTEISNFIKLNPTFYQVVPLHAVPGTPLWKKLKSQNRLIHNYKPEEDGVGTINFQPKNFSQLEIQNLVFKTYKELVFEGGPWPFRVTENLYKGYLAIKNHPDKVIKKRAFVYNKMLKTILPLAIISRLLFRGKNFQNRWTYTMKHIAKNKKGLMIFSFVKGILLLPLIYIIVTIGYLHHWLSPYGDQPETIKKIYRNQKIK